MAIDRMDDTADLPDDMGDFRICHVAARMVCTVGVWWRNRFMATTEG